MIVRIVQCLAKAKESVSVLIKKNDKPGDKVTAKESVTVIRS